jgi:hypothetical protein
MKNLKKLPVNNRGSFTTVLVVLLFAVLFLPACKRSNDDVQPGAALSVVNLISGNSAIDFYLNNQRVNGTSLLYLQRLAYFNTFPGLNKFDVTIGGTLQGLATDTATLAPGKFHSLFIVEDGNTQFLLTTDDLADPPAGKAKVRFVNVSPDAPNVDLLVSGGASLFTNQGFKSYTDFTLVDPATYTFEIQQSGESAVKATSSDIKIEAGKTYTVLVYGLWNGTAQQAFAVDAMEN